MIHRRTRVINLKSQLSRTLEPTTYHPQGDVGSNPAQGNYSFPQKLSSVEFPVTFSLYICIYLYRAVRIKTWMATR